MMTQDRQAVEPLVVREPRTPAEDENLYRVTARVFADVAEAARALREALAPGVVVLIKASRGARLERVLEGLKENEA